MDDTIIRRHPSAVRVLVLDIIATEHAPDREQVAANRQTRRPRISTHHAQQLLRMADQVLSQLMNLEWIACDDGRFVPTGLGDHARTLVRYRLLPIGA